LKICTIAQKKKAEITTIGVIRHILTALKSLAGDSVFWLEIMALGWRYAPLAGDLQPFGWRWQR
jgi:hypothetical protein